MSNIRKRFISNKTKRILDYIKALDPRNFIHILYSDKTLVVKYFDSNERVELLESRLSSQMADYGTPREYIKCVLDEILKPFSGCGYIIFQIGQNERQFVQFSVHRKKLELDFPFFPGNDHLGHMQKTRKLLESLGLAFIDDEIYPMRFSYLHCTPEKADPFDTLIADFGTNTDITTEFIYLVFTEIFQKDISKLNIKMGTGKNNLMENIRIGKAILKHYLGRFRGK